jgi:hypothetical protein
VTINPDDFSKNERPTEYEARFRVTGEIRVTIHAGSREEAEDKARAMMEDDDFGCELDGVDDVDLSRVWKSPVMYRVIRDGRNMQVSRLMEGDQPREPGEYGF